jgi:hypothetical protein
VGLLADTMQKENLGHYCVPCLFGHQTMPGRMHRLFMTLIKA